MAQIKAIFFDQDGVIIDTERDGHRVSFNGTFKEFGFDFQWDDAKYHELLQIGGGKERMAADLRLGVCTTSSEQAAHTIAYKILKDIRFEFVLAGDIVKKKKPDPEIYLLALQKAGLQPGEGLGV